MDKHLMKESQMAPPSREGALAQSLNRHGHTYTATFNKADLKNITAAGNMTFAVTLFVERQGKHIGN
jgi:hypothetical protein